ncbi:MAG: hypothetical protein ISF22_07035 [Methanomassiliicoccus sp.]|nr:hypothetical protein [Methanomassiliicoccus sp.]
MISVKVCRKCDKQYPSNVLFCPDCGSLVMKPDAPEPEPRPKAPVARRSFAAAPVKRVEAKPVPSPRVRREFTREDFFLSLTENKVAEEDIEVIKSVMAWSEGLASSVSFGDNCSEEGWGFRPSVLHGEKEATLFRIGTNGAINIHFKDWVSLPPFDAREKRVEMLGRLNSIKGVRMPESKVIERPPLPVRVLRDKDGLDKFIDAFQWLIGLVKGE